MRSVTFRCVSDIHFRVNREENVYKVSIPQAEGYIVRYLLNRILVSFGYTQLHKFDIHWLNCMDQVPDHCPDDW